MPSVTSLPAFLFVRAMSAVERASRKGGGRAAAGKFKRARVVQWGEELCGGDDGFLGTGKGKRGKGEEEEKRKGRRKRKGERAKREERKREKGRGGEVEEKRRGKGGGREECLSSAKLRSIDSVNPRAVLSRARPRYRHLL